jgi:hypothetical protein
MVSSDGPVNANTLIRHRIVSALRERIASSNTRHNKARAANQAMTMQRNLRILRASRQIDALRDAKRMQHWRDHTLVAAEDNVEQSVFHGALCGRRPGQDRLDGPEHLRNLTVELGILELQDSSSRMKNNVHRIRQKMRLPPNALAQAPLDPVPVNSLPQDLPDC